LPLFVTEISFGHDNPQLPSVSKTLGETQIGFSDGQSSKAELTMFETLDTNENVTVARCEQPEKHDSPIVSTNDGISNETNDPQAANA
jgi:hypothetical protein